MEQLKKRLSEIDESCYYLDTIDINKVDFELSLSNQARIIEPLNNDTVFIYENSLKNGDVFPPVILEKKGNLFVVLDGNHRLNAAKNIKMSCWKFGAYILSNLTPMQFRSITNDVNLKHGLATSIEDRIQHAFYLVGDGGMTKKKAAASMGLSYHVFKDAIKYKACLKRIRNVGLNSSKIIKKISKTAILHINTLHDNDLFKNCIVFASESNLCSKDTHSLILKLNKLNTTREQFKYIKEETDKIDKIRRVTGGTDLHVKNIANKINFALRKIDSISEKDIKSIPKELKKDFILSVDKCMLKFGTIRSYLEGL